MSDVNTKPITMEADEEVVDVDKIMAEFDKESNTRHFTGIFQKIIKGAMVLFSLYVMFDGWTGTMEKRQKMAWFIGIIVMFAFIIFPSHKKEKMRENHVPFYDWIFAALGGGAFFYYAINCQAIVDRASRINEFDIVMAIIGTLLLFEACRRVVGLPIVIVSSIFIVYAFFVVNRNPLRVIVYKLFYTTEGIAGTPLNVCASFIVLFIIFASFLEQSGIGAFFVDLANSIAGKSVGGPAKVAVISSAMEGMYSGSSVANTVGSGSVTIPTMKRCGYKPEFAAAVEAAASTGGQIMPPIMGAAAFLMTEYTGLPYAQIAIAAILPAVLYFTGIFMMIHFEAKKLGLKGLPKDAIPNFFKLMLKNGYLLLPIVVLVVAMNYFSAGLSACFAILGSLIVSLIPKQLSKQNIWKLALPLIPIAALLGIWLPFGPANMSTAILVSMIICVLLSFFTKDDATLTPKVVVESLENGAKNTIGVAVACGMAGLISGVVTMTALGQLLINTLVPVAENSMFLALFLTMICCIVLGMGVPTTANYVIMATITAPILIKMGLPVLAAHMFVFYFGIVADITPPVALAAYAGSAIAHSNPMKTGVTATRLAITAFIVPYIFAYSPEMLLIDAAWYDVVLIVITALIGIFAVSAGMEGYMFAKCPWWQRIMLLGGGLLCIIPGIMTDLAGVVLLAIVIVLQKITEKKNLTPPADVSASEAA